jgi:Alpha amylase, catalytic domain
LDSFEDIKRDRGCVVPPAPRWAAESPIYQLHGFGWDFGGFKGLQKMLPDIKELGMKIIYFPPVFPTEGYYNSDFFMISPSFGTEEEFKDLVKAVHRLGMKIIVDFVPNNVDMRTDLVEEHPDWFRVDEEGGIMMYGRPVLSMNHTNPECSKFLIKSCEWLVRKFDIDGFRIDVAGWWPASWKVFPPYKRAGQSLVSTTGWVEKLRARLDKVKPLFYMEEASSGVAGCKYVSHGWIDVKRRIESIKTKSEAAELVRRLHYFLQDRILHEPASVLTMFHTIMHDDFGFTLKLRGTMVPPRRATLAFIALMEGVPMFLQGFERGNRDFVRRLFLIRENLATLNHGVSRFCHVKSSNPAVLAFTRHIGDNVTICAINFYNGVAKTSFKLSAELKEQLAKKKLSLMNIGPNVDDFSMERVASGELNDIEVGPYGSVVITSEKISAKAISLRINSPVNILAASSPAKKASSGAVSIVEKGRKVIVEAGDAEYRISLDKGGLIESVRSRSNGEKICGPFTLEYEEGLFHEQSQHKKSNTDLILNRWINPGYDDSNWDDVFIMTTAISHIEWERKTKARTIFRPIDDLFLWSGTSQVRNAVSLYRKEFDLPGDVVHAELKVAVSQSHETYINNQLIGFNKELWYNPVDVTNKLKKGRNAIGIKVRHNTGCRGPLVELSIKLKSGKKIQILSDESWKAYPGMRLLAGDLSTWKSRKRGKSMFVSFEGALHMNTVGAISHRYEAPMAFISKSNIRKIETVIYRLEYNFGPSGKMDMKMTFLKGPTGKASTGTYRMSANMVNHTHWISSDKYIGTVHEQITDWSVVKGPWSGFPIRIWDTDEFQIDDEKPVVMFCNPDKRLRTEFDFGTWDETMRSYIMYEKAGRRINPQLTIERTIKDENIEEDIDISIQLISNSKKAK